MTPVALFVLVPLLLVMLAGRRARPPVSLLLEGAQAGARRRSAVR